MKRIFDYSRTMDVFNQIIEYRIPAEIKDSLLSKFEFGSEESHFAPVPSVASRVRAKNDMDFILIYLTSSNELMVFAELGIERSGCIEAFMRECPDLGPHLTNTYAIPPSPYPNESVMSAYVARVRKMNQQQSS